MSDAKTIELVRLFADASGESRFETVRWPMADQAFAPPAAPFQVSDAYPAQHFVVIELPTGWGGAEPHPTPARHLLLCLSGSFKVTASSGEVRSFTSGDALLLEDTSGQGHRTEVTSAQPVRTVMIRLSKPPM